MIVENPQLSRQEVENLIERKLRVWERVMIGGLILGVASGWIAGYNFVQKEARSVATKTAEASAREILARDRKQIEDQERTLKELVAGVSADVAEIATLEANLLQLHGIWYSRLSEIGNDENFKANQGYLRKLADLDASRERIAVVIHQSPGFVEQVAQLVTPVPRGAVLLILSDDDCPVGFREAQASVFVVHEDAIGRGFKTCEFRGNDDP